MAIVQALHGMSFLIDASLCAGQLSSAGGSARGGEIWAVIRAFDKYAKLFMLGRYTIT